jgi:hypothetical protein
MPQSRVRHHALKGHRIPAQGANPGNPPGKRNPRSEGTPHNLRVSDIDQGTPYAVFLQNTPILSDAIPRAMPWAGMRCPFRAYYAMTVPVSWAYRVSDTVVDRCGLAANCGNRGRRTRLQWRLGRLRRCFVFGFSVAGVADPGAARSVKEKWIRSCRRASHRTYSRTIFWVRFDSVLP